MNPYILNQIILALVAGANSLQRENEQLRQTIKGLTDAENKESTSPGGTSNTENGD